MVTYIIPRTIIVINVRKAFPIDTFSSSDLFAPATSISGRHLDPARFRLIFTTVWIIISYKLASENVLDISDEQGPILNFDTLFAYLEPLAAVSAIVVLVNDFPPIGICTRIDWTISR